VNRRDFLLAGSAAGALGAVTYASSPLGSQGGVGPISATTGDPVTGGTSFQINNMYPPQSNQSAVTKLLATNVGAAGTTGVQLSLTIPASPALNMPATGDHWYFMRVKMPAWGLAQNGAMETILGVTGQRLNGGGLGYNTFGYSQGNSSTGWQVDPVRSGLPYVQRQKQGTAWQLFNQSPVGHLSGINYAPGVTYGQCVGVQHAGGADHGRLVLAALGGSTPQSVSAPLACGPARPTGLQLFNIIGASGVPAGGTNPNFSGEVSDFWIVNGPFPADGDLQAVTNGATTMEAVVAQGGGTIVYHNTLDLTTVSGAVIPDDTRYATTSGMTVNNYAGARLAQVSCGPHMQNGALTLGRKTPYWVWATAPGAPDGQVWFEGTCPDPTAALQARVAYQDGTFSPWVDIGMANPTYQASIRIPIKKNFRRQIQIANRPETMICEGDLHAVGYVILILGQSEMAIQGSVAANFTLPSGTPSGGSGYGQVASSFGESVSKPFGAFLDQKFITGNGVSYSRSLGWVPSVSPITGGAMPGDGFVMLANTVMAQGVSVMLASACHNGCPKDIYIWCNHQWVLPTTSGSPSVGLPTITGSGTVASPFVFALNVTTPMARNLTGNAITVVNGNFRQQIKEGSLIITMSDGSKVTDSNSVPGTYPHIQGGLVGDGVDGASFVNYCTQTGAGTPLGTPARVSLAFTAGTSLTISQVSWQAKQEIIDGATTQKTTFVNGYGAWEAFNDVMGLFAAYGVTAAIGNWVTAELAEVGTVTGMAQDQAAKWTRLRNMVMAYALPGVDAGLAAWPMVLCNKARDSGGGNGACNLIGQLDQARAAQQSLWSTTPWGTAQIPWMWPSSWYYDDDLNGVSSPHQSPDPHPISSLGAYYTGATRIGERQALDLAAMVTNAPLPVFTWAQPVFSGNTCTISLANLGASIVTVDSFNGGQSAALDCWYVGTPTSAGTLCAPATAYTAVLSGNSVIITKAVGTFTGSEVIRYAVGMPGADTIPAPRALVYATGGSVPPTTYSPGLPLPPLWRPAIGQPDNSRP
jgi:hypothetical protein